MKDQSTRTGLTAIAAAASLLIGASLLGPTTAAARPDGGWWHPTSAQGIETRVERMTKQLDLTEAQQAELRTLMEAEQAQRAQQRQAMREQIDALLTDEQKATRDEMAQTRLDRRLERMTKRLNLTEEQAAQVKTLFEEQRTNPELTRAEVRERISAVLTDEQRAAMHDKPRRGERSKRPDCDRE